MNIIEFRGCFEAQKVDKTAIFSGWPLCGHYGLIFVGDARIFSEYAANKKPPTEGRFM